MIANLVFYQLVLIALVWLCLMLPWLWPSEPAAARPIPPTPVTPPRKRSTAPKPFPGLTRKPSCAACEQAIAAPRPPPSPLHPRRFLPHAGRRRQVDTSDHFCPDPDCRYGGWLGLGNITCQWPSQRRPLAPAALRGLWRLLSRDPRHAVAWQARRARPARMGGGRVGGRLPTICQPRSVKFSPHLHDRLTATSGGIIAGAIMQHRDQDTQQPVSNVA